jgi:hypothetical protein
MQPIAFRQILDIFTRTAAKDAGLEEGPLALLVADCFTINSRLWALEDRVRMKGSDVGIIKQDIDRSNQQRNDLIHDIDSLLHQQLDNRPSGKFYAETPGMIIDRLSILFIKQTMIGRLVHLIGEEDLKREYAEKGKRVSTQLSDLGLFLDTYLSEVREGAVFFKVYGPAKVYNDHRIHGYVAQLAGGAGDLL